MDSCDPGSTPAGSMVRRAVSSNPSRFSAVCRRSIEGEIKVYDWVLKDLRAKYDELWPNGWRLKTLAPYVVNGHVFFAVVWKPGTKGEIQVYDWALKDVRAKYDELCPESVAAQDSSTLCDKRSGALCSCMAAGDGGGASGLWTGICRSQCEIRWPLESWLAPCASETVCVVGCWGLSVSCCVLYKVLYR